MRRFIEATHPTANLEGQLRFSNQTGGFDLREIHSANAHEASGSVQETNSDQFARFTIVVDRVRRTGSSGYKMQAVPRPAAFAIARDERRLIGVGAPSQTREGRRGGSILRRRDFRQARRRPKQGVAQRRVRYGRS